MRVVVAGSRTIEDYDLVEKAILESGFPVDLVISGGAKGVDTLGVRWARKNKVQHCLFPPMWAELGKRAGPARNRWMISVGEALIAVWDQRSRGTGHIIQYAQDWKRHIYVVDLNGDIILRTPFVQEALHDVPGVLP